MASRLICICRMIRGFPASSMVPRGLEPRTLRLLAVRSSQLSYETKCTSNNFSQIGCT